MDEVKVRTALRELIRAVQVKVDPHLGTPDPTIEQRLPVGLAVDHRLLCLLLELRLENARKVKADLETINALMPVILPEVKAHKALVEILKIVDEYHGMDIDLEDIGKIARKALGKP